MILAPPSESGADHDTTDSPFAFDDARTVTGDDGGPTGVTAADGTDAAPRPIRFPALTVNV